VEVIEVVLSEAVALGACAGSVCISHALEPAVVLAKGLGKVTTNAIQSIAEVACTSADVVPGVPASVRGIAVGALFGGDLHKALLAVGADDPGVAGGLLHGDGGEENSGDIVLVGGLVEGVEVGTAVAVRVAVPGEDSAEVLGDHLVDGEVGWAPTTVLDATVEPLDGAIGTGGGARVGCGGRWMDKLAGLGRKFGTTHMWRQYLHKCSRR